MPCLEPWTGAAIARRPQPWLKHGAPQGAPFEFGAKELLEATKPRKHKRYCHKTQRPFRGPFFCAFVL